jgi:hypothetical protein
VKIFFLKPKTKKYEGEDMLKKPYRYPIRFTIRDGVEPARQESEGRPWALLAPTPLELRPGQSVTVRLGVECNYPTMVVGKHRRNLRVVGGGPFPGGEELTVIVTNADKETYILERGEQLASVFVLDNAYLFGATEERE